MRSDSMTVKMLSEKKKEHFHYKKENYSVIFTILY